MSGNKLVPKRRFKEFQDTDAWEQRKLGEMINDIADGPFGSNLKTVHYTNKKEARIIQLSNIGEYGWQDENLRYTTFEHAREIKRCIVQKNELVMAKMMPAGLTIKRPNAEEMYVLSSDAVRIKLDGILVDSSYFVFLTKSSYFLNQINNDAQGSTRTRTSISKIKRMYILTPKLKEQQKIGEFFKHLDQMISLEQRKLEKTIALKSAYLAEMFPAEGGRVPKRRFSGFKDEWKEWKLGDLAEIVRGASPRPIQDPKWFDVNSNIGWLRISDVTEQNGRINYLKQRMSILGQEKTRVLYEPHLLLSIAATVGKPVVNYVETGVHDGFLIFMNPKFDREFMFQWLEMFRPMWNKYGQPGSQVNLNSDIVKGQMIAIPSIEEQEKISEFFKKIDDTITNQKQKLNKLKAMKQAYLEEMFV